MTINSTTRKTALFTGNGATTVFAFTFKVQDSADIVVYLLEDDVETEADTSDYTVSLNVNQNTNPGGSVTFYVAPTSAQSFIISTDADATQTQDIQNQSSFNPAIVMEALDKLTIQVQQLRQASARSVALPVTAGVSGALPYAFAGKVLSFDADMNPSPADLVNDIVDFNQGSVIPTGESAANTLDDLIGGYRWNSSSLASTMVVTTNAFSSGNINAATNRLTWTAHGRWTGEGGIVSAGDGLTANTVVYYLRWYDDNTLTLHPTCEDALSGTNTVDITGTTAFTLSILRDPRQGVYKLRGSASLTGSAGALIRQLGGTVSPSMFGASKTASDNSAAIMAAFNYLRYSWNASKHAFDAEVDFEGIQYNCARPVHIFNLRQPDAKFGNGGIYSTATGKIALCLAGMNAPIIEDFEVYGDQTNSPAVGIYYGRSFDGSSAPLASDARFSNVRVQGFCSQASIVNFASETDSLVGCSFDNQHRSLTAVTSACTRNMQSWVDQFGAALTSDFGNLPTVASGNHSNILHYWSQPRITRNSVIALAISGITKANPAVVTVNAAELLASGLANGDPIFMDVDGMTQLDGVVGTIAGIDTGAGTFQLSGINSSAYSTFTAGYARNKTGSAMLLAGAVAVTGRAGYHLTYGSPSIIFDLPNGSPDGFDYEFQDENNPDQPILFRAGSGSYAIQGFRARVDSWSQTSANNIIGYEGTTGTVLIQDFYLHIPNMGTAPASGIFESPSKYTLYGANQIVPLAAALNTISGFAAYKGSTTAFDRSPKTIDYGDENALTATAVFATPGDSVLTHTQQTFRGERQDGRYSFTLLLSFSTNAYTTAAGVLKITVASLPYLPKQESPLYLSRANQAVLGGGDSFLGAYIDTDGTLYIWRFRTGADGAQATVTNFPASKSFVLHLSGSYEIND